HPDAPHLPGRRRRAGARHRPRSVPRVPAVGRQPGGEVGDRRRRDQRRPQGRVPPDLRAGDGGPAGRHLRALRPHRSADGHAGAARAVRAPPRRDRCGRDRLPDRFRGGRGPRPGRPRAPRRPARPLLRRDQSRPDRVRPRRIPGGPRRVTITLDRSKTVPVPVDAVAADAGIRPLQGPLPGEDVLDLFDRVCRAHARDVAVEWRGRAVSYRELDRLSRRLACRLRAEGLGEGDVAVLWLEDRVLWIAALLACLRSGCAFAPIDPDWPEGRRQAVLADLEPRVALVDGSAPELPGVTRLRLDEAGDGPLWAGPRAQVDADALCYVYSTSGSTGRPKGIAGRRKGLSHFIRWEIETLDLPAGPRVTQLTSPAFDASLRDVLVPLCAGGRVCIPPAPPAALDPALLVGWLAESGAQVLHCVPSLFRALAQAPAEAGSLAEMRFVLLAGEELRVPDVQAWRQRFGRGAAVVNLYGSTETTMVKLFHVVRDEDLERGFIPIGRPMKGARALLLQEDLTVTRQGSVGEIFIRSPYMTLGYYRQPEKTREVFLPNPFSQDPQDLVFRTGDLARMLEDGSFQFIGRK